MKVLHVLWAGEIGGTERSVYQFVRREAAEGRETAVLFARAAGPYLDRCRADSVPVLVAAVRSGRDLRAVPHLAALMRGFDVHHFHGMEPLLFVASVASGRKARVYTERGGRYARTSMRRVIGSLLLRRWFHAYAANTQHAARELARTARIPLPGVAVAFNGLDFSLLRPTRRREEVRRSLALPPGAVVAGSVAHLKPWKRLDLLLDAVAATGDPLYRVLIVGDGPDRPRLEARAQALGLGERAVFTGNRHDVPDLLCAMDVFVMPSGPLESFGNAVVEAMALGVPPIVLADSPGPAGHIEHGKTGFVADSPRELPDLLKLIGADAVLRETVGRRAAAVVRERYTLDGMAAAYHALYERAVARAGLIPGARRPA